MNSSATTFLQSTKPALGDFKSELQNRFLRLGLGYTASDISYESRNKNAKNPRMAHQPKWICHLTIADAVEFTSIGCRSIKEAEGTVAFMALMKWDLISRELRRRANNPAARALGGKLRFHANVNRCRQALAHNAVPEYDDEDRGENETPYGPLAHAEVNEEGAPPPPSLQEAYEHFQQARQQLDRSLNSIDKAFKEACAQLRKDVVTALRQETDDYAYPQYDSESEDEYVAEEGPISYE